ncbi:hypothetical protein PIB30_072280 [Stylosanthes scabra]|uniref:Annexin n=1 Tax=Stylosanthes scabra TaxID=79078 RepID=A0ABU6XPA4_9FABA|nr:hypothetical protein [Stylosanthes scabra]
MATLVVPPVPPSARDDAMNLHHALTGIKCDTDAVVNLLAHRDATQRAEIDEEYKAIHTEELSASLEKGLMERRDAVIIRQCLAVDSSFHGATEILLAYLSNPREEEDDVDKELAGKDAKALYKAGEKRLGTDEDTFIQIFTEQSAPHLVAVNSYYNHVHGHSLRKGQP